MEDLERKEKEKKKEEEEEEEEKYLDLDLEFSVKKGTNFFVGFDCTHCFEGSDCPQ